MLGRLSGADDRDTVLDHGLALLGELAVAAGFRCARSTITEPGCIRSTVEAGISSGAGRPGTAAVVMITSDSGRPLGQTFLLLAKNFVGRFLGVSTCAGQVGAGVDFDELAAETFDLLFHDRAGVVRLDHSAESARGADGHQPGHTGADHQHLGRRNIARGGGQQREELRQLVRGDQHGLVAANCRLGGESVHVLRARGAREWHPC